MLTGTTLEAVVLLALLAVVHAVVGAAIARRLTRTGQAPAETRNDVLPGNLARISASDRLRKRPQPAFRSFPRGLKPLRGTRLRAFVGAALATPHQAQPDPALSGCRRR